MTGDVSCCASPGSGYIVVVTELPSLAEQTALAAEVLKFIGPAVKFDDRWFRVVQFSNELRFFEQNARWGGPGRSAHVQILRADLVKAAILPGGCQDRVLDNWCVRVTRAALLILATKETS